MMKTRPEEGGDWSATFRGRQEDFAAHLRARVEFTWAKVDIYSDDDTYSTSTWQKATECPDIF